MLFFVTAPREADRMMSSRSADPHQGLELNYRAHLKKPNIWPQPFSHHPLHLAQLLLLGWVHI